MSGVAGAVIGLASGAQSPIGGTTKAVADGTTSGRGCTTNFIGFGLGATNQVQVNSDTGAPIEDFNATDDTVTLAIAAGADYEPTYTADVLSWADTTP